MKFKNILIFSLAAVMLMGAFAFGAFFFLTHIPWVDLSVLEHHKTGTPTIVLDDEGKEWARFELDHRKPVPLASMPDHLIKAFLAAEDHTFFSHSGISVKGIMRSIYVNLTKRGKVQGASTITQQLVRLLFFDQKKTFVRKVKEQLLSLSVERQFTKEHILETYLNHIYFGCGIYGVETACHRFWQKSVKDISVDEAAVLAAIIRSPVRNCPLTHPDKTLGRRNVILASMKNLGFISSDTFSELTTKPLAITNEEVTSCNAAHAREQIRIFMEHLVGRDTLYTGGFVIQTTLNSHMQSIAQTTFKKHMAHLKTKLAPDVDGALISLDVNSGAIKALVGGYDFKTSQFNRAIHARRQLGSIFKPIIFAVGVEHGHDFNEIDTDEPITLTENGSEWSPQNFNKKFEGQMTLAHALALSKNTIPIKLLLRTGIPHVIEVVPKFHLSQAPEPYPSLALGCIDASTIEVAGMLNVFANKGIYCQPYLIQWIKDSSNKKIWKCKGLQEQAISWSTSSKVAQALSISLERYRQKNPDKWGTTQVFGKTGTTNQSRTCWFGGATPSYTTVVYVGKDNNQPLGKDVYPSRTAFPIWLEYNRTITHQTPHFEFDPSLTPVTINPLTGKHIDPDAPEAITILCDGTRQH